MKRMSTLRRAQGFSLVEVMVALIIIAVGMLGIAKMQALALSSTGSAGTRSLVAIEASSLAASMHANRDYWAGAPTLVTNVGVQGGVVNIDVPTLASAQTTCVACTNTQLAAYDLQAWGAALAQVVPAANANITCQNATAPLSCVIQITWIENATGLSAATAANDLGSAPSAIQQPQYTLYVEP